MVVLSRGVTHGHVQPITTATGERRLGTAVAQWKWVKPSEPATSVSVLGLHSIDMAGGAYIKQHAN